MAIAAKVLGALSSADVEYETVSHPKTYTSADTASAAHVADDHIAKGVVLTDEKGYVLAVIPASQWVDTHRLREELNRDLHLAPENEVDELFSDCESGAIPPLGAAYGVDMVLDEALMSLATVYFEAGDHERLIQVDGDGFRQLMKGVRRSHISNED